MQKKKIKISKKRHAQMMQMVKRAWDCVELMFFLENQFEQFLIKTMKMDPDQANVLAHGYSTRDFTMQAIAKRFTVD